MSNKNRDENVGALIGIGLSLLLVAAIQAIGAINGDSDDIFPRHIEQALAVCENNDGLYMIDGEMLEEHRFLCQNGAVFVFDKNRYKTITVVHDFCLSDYEEERTKEEVDYCAEQYTKEVLGDENE